ncbi:MAG: L,D-transpeptidase [Prevotella sp.]|nr:L,D-transpeptidase [Bacteroides sp.]MCM1365661.1 L,D-transpeptidase [Prevotella sp.]
MKITSFYSQYIYGILYVLSISLLFASCAQKNKTEEADTFPTVMPEVIDTGRVDTTKRDNGTPYVHFDTKEQAIKYIENSPKVSEYKRGIIWPMVNDNLEYAEKLLNNTHDRFLVVDKGSMRVIVYNKYGVEEVNYGIACARNFGTKHKKADTRTPEGFFSVEGIYDSTDWLFTNDNGYTSPARGQFGPRFIRLKIPTTTQIGLHGTAAPGSIGRRASHGCIRLTNENILKLVKMVEKGTPVIVSPGPRDRAVNEKEGVNIYSVKTGYEENYFKNLPDQRNISEPKGGVKSEKVTNDSTAVNSEEIQDISTPDENINVESTHKPTNPVPSESTVTPSGTHSEAAE